MDQLINDDPFVERRFAIVPYLVLANKVNYDHSQGKWDSSEPYAEIFWIKKNIDKNLPRWCY